MAGPSDDMIDVLNALSLADDDPGAEDEPTTTALDDGVRAKLDDLNANHESIFSWHINERTGNNTALLTDMVTKIRGKCDMIEVKENAFDLDRFNLKLIICFELFVHKKYDESLREIKDIVEYTSLCPLDEANREYSNAVSHIALSTHAYIALSMDLDCEKIIENIKSTNCMNDKEKSAICAIKAFVFLNYPPNGNDIALGLAEEARNLNPTELEWVLIWMKAKGHLRRYNKRNGCPDNSELDAIEIIINMKKPKSKFYNLIAGIYVEKALYYRNQYNRKECTKYYWLASNYLKKAILLEESENNVVELSHSFRNYIYLPQHLQSIPDIEKMVEKLQRFNYNIVNFILGKYYLKIKKNYEQAKIYYTRALNNEGSFFAAMELFEVECLLHKDDRQFAYVDTLNMIYDSFQNPRRRLIILAQLLIYCYFEDNPKEIMRYLKLYMDQDMEDSPKKEILYKMYPFSFHRKSDVHYKNNELLSSLTVYVRGIMFNRGWNGEEKMIAKDTLKRFNQMLRSCATNDNVD